MLLIVLLVILFILFIYKLYGGGQSELYKLTQTNKSYLMVYVTNECNTCKDVEKRLKANMSICLESKYFDELYSIDESKNQPYIYWLQYLYDYLSIDVRDKEWAREMLELLDEEQFLTENKYLSQFFFKDFYLSSEPNCIKDPKSDTSVNNDI